MLRVDIPHSWEFDGASIPGWALSATSGRFMPTRLRASLLHDYLFRYNPLGWDQKTCDDAFLVALRGDKDKKAWLLYRGVRAGGWAAWRKYRKQEKGKKKK